MILTLDSRPQHDFVQYYFNILKDSGLFSEIKYEELPECTHILELQPIVYNFGRGIRHRHGRMTVFKINIDNKVKTIVLDTQFADGFSCQYFKHGLLNVVKPDIYIKYDNRCQQLIDSLPCPLKVWVMFPCGPGLVNKFKWTPGGTDNAMATGPHSLDVMSRRLWFSKAKQLGFTTLIGRPQEEYLAGLLKSKWGVSLSVRNEKNTREYEFISNLMPLALNYQPYYDQIPFAPMEHYFYMSEPDDLEKLLTTDPTSYHLKSKWIWENYFRPDKAVELLLSWLK